VVVEKEITVVDDAEFERVALAWGYDLSRIRSVRECQGQEFIEIDALSRVASGIQWIIIRRSRWEEIQEAISPGEE
jgi:hypothetical protein